MSAVQRRAALLARICAPVITSDTLTVIRGVSYKILWVPTLGYLAVLDLSTDCQHAALSHLHREI
jgi:hypothetical protein